MLRVLDYPTDGMRSKSWEEFAAPDAPVMDFVFTVCDNAAGESCPVWPGQPMTAHWGIEDPAAVEGTNIEKEAAFVAAFRYLKNRIGVFTNLPMRSIDKLSLGTKLREIGRLEGATHPTRRQADGRHSISRGAWRPKRLARAFWSPPWSAPASWPRR